MAAVSVFVDDAIRGTLPLVCAKTGDTADIVVRMRQPVGGMPKVLWLAALFPPVGFVGVFLLALLWPGEQLTVRIPQTDASFERERHMQRLRLAALGAGVVVPLAGVMSVGMFLGLWLALGVAFFVVAGALSIMLWRETIGVSIDVTRRWVTLTNVHPDFVEAVERKEVLTPRT